MKKWEYYKHFFVGFNYKALEEDHNFYGKQGWELVSVCFDSSTNQFHSFFKREKNKS